MIVKSLGVFSIAKISGISYALMGIILGIIISFFRLAEGGLANQQDMEGETFSMLFGAGAFFFLPMFYGVFGFISGALMAWVYNIGAKYVGGIEVEFESDNPSLPNA